jgi:hypothetical protein
MPVVAKDVNSRDRVQPLIEPPAHFAAVTPSDTDELTYVTRALYIGGDGNVCVIGKDNSAAVTFVGLKAGAILVGRFKQVKSSGTTATNLVAQW